MIAAMNFFLELDVLEKIFAEGSITTHKLAALVGTDESAIGTGAQKW